MAEQGVREGRRVRRSRELVQIAVPVRSGLRVSERTFWRLCQDNPDLRLERTAKGELIVMAPASLDSGGRNADLSGQLWSWNRRTKLGRSFDSSAGYTLPNTAIRGPDASWMTRERWESLSLEERRKFSHIVPDFVAELRSPSDGLKKLREKMDEYITQGVRLAWLIDPIGQAVEIYRPGREVETLRKPATLSGEDVLPGFALDLKGILFD